MADKKSRWFSKIETREDALKTIKDSSWAFLFVAALQGALGVLVLQQHSMLLDAAVFAVAALALRRYNSRAAAVVLLVVAFFMAGTTLANRLGIQSGGGNNIFLAAIVVWAAVRAVQATYRLRRLMTQEDTNPLIRAG